MSPRNYDMSKRAAAAAETRRRIIDATRALHTEQGIAATGWDAIASRAGVGVGTVYRHFPTLDDLVPACGTVAMEIVALPSADSAAAVFEGLDDPASRIARLVSEVFAIYERGAAELHVVRREPDAHPSVAELSTTLEATLSAFVDAALPGASMHDRAIARGLVDLDTWEALRRAGLDDAAAAAEVRDMLTARLAAYGGRGRHSR
jgi:AcrR family transcriptional regulator